MYNPIMHDFYQCIHHNNYLLKQSLYMHVNSLKVAAKCQCLWGNCTLLKILATYYAGIMLDAFN